MKVRLQRLYAALMRHTGRMDYTPLLLIWATAVFYSVFCFLLDLDPIGASNYNTYTLQALAWRSGQISLGRDYPHLELAVFNNDWFVSFPPVPSIPLYFLTFLFGAATPDHLLVKLYLLTGVLACYYMLRRAKYDKVSACAFALFCSAASCLLTLTTDGAVWYQAQTLAFALTMCALALMYSGHPTPALLLYALSVGCRPFNVFYALPLFALFILRAHRQGQPFKTIALRLLPGVLLGLCVAGGYAWYNYARFGNPLEFGHNYLPEFSTQGGIQFSLSHLSRNIRTFLFGAPFSDSLAGSQLNIFGFSMFFSCPVFFALIVWVIEDLIRRRFSLIKLSILLAFAIQLFCLLLHRTFGGYQFGARYTCDLLPYTALYLALPGRCRRMRLPEWLLFIAAFGFSLFGAATILL